MQFVHHRLAFFSMALVFKIKFQDTLRRWMYVAETADVPSFQQLEARIREMFDISLTVLLVITYVDKENDVVTFADDRDVVDACLVQRLNPLRLDVKIREEELAEPSSISPESAAPGKITSVPNQTSTIKSFLKPLFPAAAMKEFLSRYAQIGAAGMFTNVQEGSVSYDGSQAANPPSQSASYNPHKHAHGVPPLLAPSRFFHKGIRCDGCGMSPIEGSRFLSTKMPNYDLCSSCFQAMGNEIDFLRIDFPAFPPLHRAYTPPRPARGRRHHMGPQPFRPTFARGSYGWKPEYSQPYCPPSEASGKLDARFVKDVTICNDTEMAPCTKFTKIWRLKNTGTLPWPTKTRLVHIGGDVLSSEEAGILELPEGGLPCGEDVEASLDIIAPEEAGRYVSHWRLMSPSGQKFGHRVWAVIQVVPQAGQFPQFQGSIEEVVRTEGLQKGAITVEEQDAATSLGAGKGNESVQSKQAMVHVIEKREDELASDTQNGREKQIDGFAESDIKGAEKCSTDQAYATVALLVAAEKGQLDGSDLLNSEVDGFSVVEKPTQKSELYNISQHRTTESNTLDKQLEQHKEKFVVDAGSNMDLQLQFLESMGYVDRAFNKYLLEKNNEDLDLTVDDLVISSGWDAMLKDLHEMGFDDKSTNRQLLIKNEGSMKRVVKDLVEMEKQNVRWGSKDSKGKTIRRSS